MSQPVRTRVAPSPTGYPHIGTAYQALFDYVYAKKHHGKFIIRIEDTDVTREVKGSEDIIYQGLEWLGLIPDEGPKYGGNFGPYRQSERLAIYQQYAHQLVASGHAYYCFCSKKRLDSVRKKQQKQGKPPMYDQHCRQLDVQQAQEKTHHQPYVVRLKVPLNKTISFIDEIRGEIKIASNVVDDQVLLKSDGYPTYHLAVVVDDHLMKITHVIRGEEWISSAPKHILLYQFFGWDRPKFIHLPLLRNSNRSKISKRHGHTSIFWYRDQGYLKEAVINFLATRVWNHPQGKEVFGIDELVKHFDFSAMHLLGPIVDLNKLNWLNGQWIRSKSDPQLLQDLEPFRPKELPIAKLKQILPLIKERLTTLSQLPEFTSYFVSPPKLDPQIILKESQADAQLTKAYLSQAQQVLAAVTNWSATNLETQLRQFQSKTGWKPRPAFMTLRLAITGRTATPPLFATMEVIGQKQVIARLSHAQKIL